jgi:hypothetical protein
MLRWRIKLVTGEVRDVELAEARWAISKKLARFVERIWEINDDTQAASTT